MPLGLFCLLCGIAAMFDAETVNFNGSPQTGIGGLIGAMLMYPIFLLFISCFIWIGAAPGLWMYSWFKEIEIEFEDAIIIGHSKSDRDRFGRNPSLDSEQV